MPWANLATIATRNTPSGPWVWTSHRGQLLLCRSRCRVKLYSFSAASWCRRLLGKVEEKYLLEIVALLVKCAKWNGSYCVRRKAVFWLCFHGNPAEVLGQLRSRAQVKGFYQEAEGLFLILVESSVHFTISLPLWYHVRSNMVSQDWISHHFTHKSSKLGRASVVSTQSRAVLRGVTADWKCIRIEGIERLPSLAIALTEWNCLPVIECLSKGTPCDYFNILQYHLAHFWWFYGLIPVPFYALLQPKDLAASWSPGERQAMRHSDQVFTLRNTTAKSICHHSKGCAQAACWESQHRPADVGSRSDLERYFLRTCLGEDELCGIGWSRAVEVFWCSLAFDSFDYDFINFIYHFEWIEHNRTLLKGISSRLKKGNQMISDVRFES